MNKPIYERGRTSACFHLLPVIALEDMSSGFVTGQIVPVKSRSDRNAAVFAVCGHPAKARNKASDRMEQNMCCCGQNSRGINRKKYLGSDQSPKICVCGQNRLADERESDRSVSKVC